MLRVSLVLLMVGCNGPTKETASLDADQDGFSEDIDCNDHNESIFPGAEETCDEADQDCDGVVDNDAADAAIFYADADGDGSGDPTQQQTGCTAPDGFVADNQDCDDTRTEVSPTATESCNGEDDDCDGTIDNGVLLSFFVDADGDGYGDNRFSVQACSSPAGYTAEGGDCDDSDTRFHPGADEDNCADPADYNCDGSVLFSDTDGDSYSLCEDCDDHNAAIHPSAIEICDASDTDEDCNGLSDDNDSSATGQTVTYTDRDGDGYGDDTTALAACDGLGVTLSGDCDDADSAYNPSISESDCTDPHDYNCDGSVLYSDRDQDGVAACEDCDDSRAEVRPGATEQCNLIDDNCDGVVDESTAADALTWFLDGDGDRYGDAGQPSVACTVPAGYVANSDDCDDTNASISPSSVESCNQVDDNCDGITDEATAVDAATWYEDRDNDGYGNFSSTVAACNQPTFYLADSTDCDDSDASVYPGAAEFCNSVDDDCNGTADNDPVDPTTWYLDQDGDAYGTVLTTTACEVPAGYTDNADDCDDTQAATHPGATEICDAANADEDCDGTADDLDFSVDTSGYSTFYADADGDSYGNLAVPHLACDVPSGSVADSSDCDDTSAAIHPGANEICDSKNTDEDCDGLADDADSSVLSSSFSTFYADLDQDGFGASTLVYACDLASGRTTVSSDCNDGNAAINPGVSEICDAANVDEDCDTLVDDADTATGKSTWYADKDGDGYGDSSRTTQACDAPVGYLADKQDCNDAVAAINPGATEVCDGANTDEDCDGLADNNDPSSNPIGKTPYYVDTDSDGYGSTTVASVCDLASGYSANNLDCDDSHATVYPGNTEICDDLLDNDCDGTANSCKLSGTGTLSASSLLTYTGSVVSGYAGYSTDFAGDVNGDGYDDLLIGQPIGASTTNPSVFLLYGSSSPSSAKTSTLPSWAQASSNVGRMVSGAGDVDHDGYDDYVFADTKANSNGGAAYLIYGGSTKLSGINSPTAANASFTGYPNNFVGVGLNEIGDFDKDGYADFAIGTNSTPAGGFHMIFGSATRYTGSTYAGNSAITMVGENGSYAATQPNQVAGVDLNADGYSDLVVGGYVMSVTYIVLGGARPANNVSITTEMDIKLTDSSGGYLGYSVSGAGDFNDDGYEDLLVGAPFGLGNYGEVYLIPGKSSGWTGSVAHTSLASLTIQGNATDSTTGAVVKGVGDINRDGVDDIVLGSSAYNSVTGKVSLFFGASTRTGTIAVTTADYILTGSATSQYFGSSISDPGDLNGDTYGDYAIGAPTANFYGSVSLVRGLGL